MTSTKLACRGNYTKQYPQYTAANRRNEAPANGSQDIPISIFKWRHKGILSLTLSNAADYWKSLKGMAHNHDSSAIW
jgi:hypothetical protein